MFHSVSSTPITFPSKLPTKQGNLEPLSRSHAPSIRSGSPVATPKLSNSNYFLPPPKPLPGQPHLFSKEYLQNQPSIRISRSKNYLKNIFSDKMPLNRSLKLQENPVQNFSTSLALKQHKSELVPSQGSYGVLKEKGSKVENKLGYIISSPSMGRNKHTESWSGGSSPYSKGLSEFADTFMENTRKYKISYVTRSPQARTNVGGGGFRGATEIDEIKQYFREPGLKKIKFESRSTQNEFKGMEDINIVKKNGQTLTQEEELKVKLMRKKVEISNVFRSQTINDEQKKAYYKQLVLEFHPDKTKHSENFAVDIFHFLQSNKDRFLACV